MRRAIFGAVLLLGGLLLAVPASAFQYADCNGHPCAWQSMPPAYEIQEPLGVDIEDEAAVEEIQASFNRWDFNHQTFCAPLAFDYQGRTATKKPTVQDYHNVISFRTSNWLVSADALAITLLYSDSSGKLREADIVFNAVNYRWTAGESDTADNLYSIRATLTHEAGHFWGLDHSSDKFATMNAYYKPNIVVEDLDEDDIRAAAERYCDTPLPADDADEQNDSFSYFADLGDRTEVTDRRLYDDDWYRLDLKQGKRLKLIVTDESPDRYKRLELYDLQNNLVDEQDCIGDCAQALGEAGEARRVALRITGGFDHHTVETARYDIRFAQVKPGDEGNLTDDDSADTAVDAQGGNGRGCGCAVGAGRSEADWGFAATALLLGAALLRRRPVR